MLFIRRPEKPERPVRRPSAVPHAATELFSGAANLFGPNYTLPKAPAKSALKREERRSVLAQLHAAPPAYMRSRTPSTQPHSPLAALEANSMMTTSFNLPSACAPHTLQPKASPTGVVGFTDAGVLNCGLGANANGSSSLPHYRANHQLQPQAPAASCAEDPAKARQRVNDLILAKLYQQVKLIAEHFRRNEEEMDVSFKASAEDNRLLKIDKFTHFV